MRAIAVAFAIACACVLPVRPALGAADGEAGLAAGINAVRASRGLPPLALHSELERKADDWVAHLAAAGSLVHSDPTEGITADWVKLAENLGVGSSTAEVEAELLASPVHYANIVNPAMTHIGIGVVSAGGRVYVVEELMQLRMTASAAVATPPPAQAVPVSAQRPPASQPAPAPSVLSPVRPKPAAVKAAAAPAPSASASTPAGQSAPVPPAEASVTLDLVEGAAPPAPAVPEPSFVPEPPATPVVQVSPEGRNPAGQSGPTVGSWLMAGLAGASTWFLVWRVRLRRKPSR